MNESSSSVDIPESGLSKEAVSSRLHEAANVTAISCVTSEDGSQTIHRCAAKTVSKGVAVLVTVKVTTGGKGSAVVVNCEKMAIASMLVKEIKKALL